jgi:dipeptidyl aminopeptidase/acylaminoacyl peptidase
MHGMEDHVVPAQSSRSAARMLLEAGVPVETVYRPGLGHDIDEVEIREGALFLERILSGTKDRTLFPRVELSRNIHVKSHLGR